MSYKTEFQSNNTDLQAILDAVNTLPEASNGIEFSHVRFLYDTISANSYTYMPASVTSYYAMLCIQDEDEYCMVKVVDSAVVETLKSASTFHIESEEGYVNFHNTATYSQDFVFGYLY